MALMHSLRTYTPIMSVNVRRAYFAASTIKFAQLEEKHPAAVMHSVMDPSLDTVRGQMIALLPRLRRFAIALTGSVADGDDLVQDTVERALRSLHHWERGTRLDSWMFRIARNRFIDGRRIARREGMVVMDAPKEAGNACSDGEAAMLARLTLEDLSAAMTRLPLEQREAVALVLINGASYREAADLLEVPIGTLTSRIARARESLAAAVGE